MDAYFDKLGFDTAVKQVFTDFLHTYQLQLYRSDMGDVYVEPKPILHTKLITVPVFTQSSMLEIHSSWNRLKVHQEYIKSLVISLYEIDSTYIEALNHSIVKFIAPHEVASALPHDLKTNFLLDKKSSLSLFWDDTWFIYMGAMLNYDNNKAITFKKLLSHNKIPDNQEDKILKLLHMYIEPEEQLEFSQYITTVSQQLFEIRKDLFVLEINKSTFYKATLGQAKEERYTQFLANMSYAFQQKTVNNVLGINQVQISQRQKGYSHYRFIFSGPNIQEEKIISFIRIFMSTYAQNYHFLYPNKKEIINMVEKIILYTDLQHDLGDKENSSRNKI